MGDDGDAGFRYMRNGRFTSYVALEFEDTEKKSLFTTGIVCDCYKDQSFDSKWFILHSQGFRNPSLWIRRPGRPTIFQG